MLSKPLYSTERALNISRTKINARRSFEKHNMLSNLIERAPPQIALASFKTKTNKRRGALSKNTMFYCMALRVRVAHEKKKTG